MAAERLAVTVERLGVTAESTLRRLRTFLRGSLALFGESGWVSRVSLEFRLEPEEGELELGVFVSVFFPRPVLGSGVQ